METREVTKQEMVASPEQHDERDLSSEALARLALQESMDLRG